MFFKKKQIIWWSDIPNFLDVHPILPANKYIPQWWKDIKIEETNLDNNIKLCPSFLDYFRRGWIITLWCDLILKKDNFGQISWISPYEDFKFSFHGDNQFKNLVPEHISKEIACVIKPHSPYKCKTPKGWSLLQLPVSYHYNPDWYVLSGIFPASKWHQTNQQMIIKKSIFKDSNEVVIKKGTPLAHYIPIPDEELSMKMTEETEYLKKCNNIATLTIHQTFKRRFTRLKKSKCPYSE